MRFKQQLVVVRNNHPMRDGVSQVPPVRNSWTNTSWQTSRARCSSARIVRARRKTSAPYRR